AKEWKRDGIDEKVPQGVTASPASWWLYQMLALIPPSHWEGFFHASPEELIAAAEVCEEGQVLLQGWTHATLDSEEQSWIGALWDFWYRHEPPLDPDFSVCPPGACLTELLKIMAPDQAEPRALRVFDKECPIWTNIRPAILEALPIPWSVPLAR